MTRCGRSWTACLAAAIAAGGVAPLVAAPPNMAESAQMQAAGGPAGSDAIGSNSEPNPFTQPESDKPIITPNGSPAAYVRSSTMAPAPGRAQVFVQPDVAGWIAVTGAFRRQGSYELAGDSITLGELVERCGGVTADASGRLLLVRNGKPFGSVNTASELLRPGDLLIAERQSTDSSSGTPAGSTLDPQHDRIDCEVGIIGLTDRPLVVRIPVDYATVDGMLSLTGQTHLTPSDVAVLVGGQRETRGDQVTALSDGAVLVFDPLRVNADAVASHPPRTNYFHIASATPGPKATITRVAGVDGPAPEISTSDMPSLAASSDSSAPRSMATSVVSNAARLPVDPEPPTAIALAPPTANAPPSPIDDELTPVPPVEMLAPPGGEPQLRYPRMADRTGTTPIGPPEADSHIVPVPVDAFYPDEPATATDVSPNAAAAKTVGAPVDNADATPTDPSEAVAPIDLSEADRPTGDEELPFNDLLPTLLLGASLGGLTFITLRWLRRRGSISRLAQRQRVRQTQAPAPLTLVATATPEPELPAHAVAEPEDAPFAVESPSVESTTEDTMLSPGDMVLSPGDLLAALVADRLVVREEVVVLPMTQRLHGRSTAMKKRRVDCAAAETVPEPHLVLPASQDGRDDTDDAAASTENADARERSAHGTRRRIDSLSRTAAETVLASGTPFERALAARHRAQNHAGE